MVDTTPPRCCDYCSCIPPPLPLLLLLLINLCLLLLLPTFPSATAALASHQNNKFPLDALHWPTARDLPSSHLPPLRIRTTAPLTLSLRFPSPRTIRLTHSPPEFPPTYVHLHNSSYSLPSSDDRDHNHHRRSSSPPCTWTGSIDGGGLASLSSCHLPRGYFSGLLLTPEGVWLLSPHPTRKRRKRDHPHVVLPPSVTRNLLPLAPDVLRLPLSELKKAAALAASDAAIRQRRRSSSTSSTLTPLSDGHERRSRAPPTTSTSSKKFVELAVFTDPALYTRMEVNWGNDTASRLRDYVTAMVRTMDLLYRQDSLGKDVLGFRVVEVNVLRTLPASLDTSGGKAKAYLSSFCDYAGDLNVEGGRWDHALLLTGLDLQEEGVKSTAGLAWAGTMCYRYYSCSVAEGASFGAAFIVTHEMGHSLGMEHDGVGVSSNCDANAYIMSPSTGPGKVTWSSCSAGNLKDFLAYGTSELRAAKVSEPSPPTCLSDSVSAVIKSKKSLEEESGSSSASLPGRKYDAYSQCAMGLGKDFKPYFQRHKPPFNNICWILYCGNGTHAVSTHPALEGTKCDKDKVCRGGQCVAKDYEKDTRSAAHFKVTTTALTRNKGWWTSPSTEDMRRATVIEGGRTTRETIHSGHFMVSDFEPESEAQDEEYEVGMPIPPGPPEETVTAPSPSAVPPPPPAATIEFMAPLTPSPPPQPPPPATATAIVATNHHHHHSAVEQPAAISIDGSLTKLFQCMSLAYRQKLTSPKWNRFKGVRLRWKDKIRLNNVIWRCWHMQFILKRKTLVCQFASPLETEGGHAKAEAVVMEGKYWKRKLSTVAAEYKKWRLFYRNRIMGWSHAAPTPDLLHPVSLDGFDWNRGGGPFGSISNMLFDDDLLMDFTDTLFSSLSSNQPFPFPNPREIARAGMVADFIQPGLVQLQPNLEDFMDTLEPLQDYVNSKLLPPVPEEGEGNLEPPDSLLSEDVMKGASFTAQDFSAPSSSSSSSSSFVKPHGKGVQQQHQQQRGRRGPPDDSLLSHLLTGQYADKPAALGSSSSSSAPHSVIHGQQQQVHPPPSMQQHQSSGGGGGGWAGKNGHDVGPSGSVIATTIPQSLNFRAMKRDGGGGGGGGSLDGDGTSPPPPPLPPPMGPPGPSSPSKSYQQQQQQHRKGSGGGGGGDVPYKAPHEHRRVCHINAEQKRRCNIKNGFDTLHGLIPSLSGAPGAKVSKAAMLGKGAEYIRTLKAERASLKEEIEARRAEVEALNSAINNCQALLPATGAPVSRTRTNRMTDMFNAWVHTRTHENWKFWIFSMVIRPLLDSYVIAVSTASVDELCRTVLAWVDQHCSLVDLRPVVLNSLRTLCTTTDILQNPSALPEEAYKAVALDTKPSSVR